MVDQRLPIEAKGAKSGRRLWWVGLVAVMVAFLPLVLTFNEALTSLMERLVWYSWLQEVVVPLQVRLVGQVVTVFGVDYIPLREGLVANTVELHMTWNCLGWQSMLLYIGSALVAFRQDQFTRLSRLKAFWLGILGVFWANIFRMSATVLLAVYAMPVYRVVFHDVLAALVSVVFLVGFWAFAFRYVLEVEG